MKSYQLILFLLISVNIIAQDYQDCDKKNCKFCTFYIKYHLATYSDWEASWTKNYDTRSANNNQETNILSQRENENSKKLKSLKLGGPEDYYTLENKTNYGDNLATLRFKLILPTKSTDLNFKVTMLDFSDNSFEFTFSMIRRNGEPSQIKISNDVIGEKVYPIESTLGSLEIELKNDFTEKQKRKFELEIKDPFPKNESEDKIGDLPILKERNCVFKNIKFQTTGNQKKDIDVFWKVEDIRLTYKPIQSESTKKESIQPQNNKSMDWYKSGNTIFAIYVANENYVNLRKLVNPNNDLIKLRNAFKEFYGNYYQDTVFFNLKANNFHSDSIINQGLLDKLDKYDIILFHYGGHGFTYDNVQYWAPVDFIKTLTLDDTQYQEYMDATSEGARVDIINTKIKTHSHYKDPKHFIDRLYNNLKEKCIVFISDACRDDIQLEVKSAVHSKDDDRAVTGNGKKIIRNQPINAKNPLQQIFNFNETRRNIFMIKYAVPLGAPAEDENSYTSKMTTKLISKCKNIDFTFEVLTSQLNTPEVIKNQGYTDMKQLNNDEHFYFHRTKLKQFFYNNQQN